MIGKTVEEAKTKLRKKWIGTHSIHGFGIRADRTTIYIYHETDVPDEVKGQIEQEAQPYRVSWNKEDMPVAK